MMNVLQVLTILLWQLAIFRCDSWRFCFLFEKAKVLP